MRYLLSVSTDMYVCMRIKYLFVWFDSDINYY